MSICLCNDNITLIFLKNINIWLKYLKQLKFCKANYLHVFIEELLIIDKNIICHFMYLRFIFEKNNYFYKKTIRTFLSKLDKI